MDEKVTCPECGGFGYHENGTSEGRECLTCHGDGTVSPDQVKEYLAQFESDVSRRRRIQRPSEN